VGVSDLLQGFESGAKLGGEVALCGSELLQGFESGAKLGGEVALCGSK